MSAMSLSDGIASSSLVSDAASLVDKKVAHSKQVEEFYVNRNVKSSCLKKRKDAITALIDDSLEDTATSPLKHVLIFMPFFIQNQNLDS